MFRALDQGVVVDLTAATDPGVLAALDSLTSVGIHPIVKLAATEFACVVYCVGTDDDPDAQPVALSAIGEAAHPDRDVAITKALLEFASSRARRNFAFGPLELVEKYDPDYLAAELARPVGPQEARAFETMRAWTEYDADRMRSVLAPIFRAESQLALDALPSSAARAPGELLELLLDRLLEFDVLVVPGGRPGDMRCAKVLAPGLEVETMSYLRIGERGTRQLLARGSDLVGRGEPSDADQLPVPLTAAAQDRLGGPVWIDRAAVRRAVGELYPLYREPRRHAVQRLAVD
jgi:ribosomal protein S12 methylthiotransferase accessory factor